MPMLSPNSTKIRQVQGLELRDRNSRLRVQDSGFGVWGSEDVRSCRYSSCATRTSHPDFVLVGSLKLLVRV